VETAKDQESEKYTEHSEQNEEPKPETQEPTVETPEYRLQSNINEDSNSNAEQVFQSLA
jgi:hypothetical protein